MLRLFKSNSASSEVKKNEKTKALHELSFEEFRVMESELCKKKPESPHRELAITTLLQHVVNGEQKQAEAMLKKEPNLALLPGKVKDYSGRTFYNITALKYAFWSLDRHMWEMITSHVSFEEIDLQLKEFEQSGGVDYLKNNKKIRELTDHSLLNLIEAMQSHQIYQTSSTWQKINEAQKNLPVHVVNEYLRSDRSFYPTPDFLELILPRMTYFYNYDYWPVFNPGGDWYHQKDYVFLRGAERGNWIDSTFSYKQYPEVDFDLSALIALNRTRRAEVELFKKWLAIKNESKHKATVATLETKVYPEPSAPSETLAFIDEKEAKLNAFLNQCTPRLQSYVHSFIKQKPLSKKIAELKPTVEEEKLFEGLVDCITEEYLDIPVTLNERNKLYNFETIVKLSVDPHSQETFSPLQVQSARDLIDEGEKIIERIKGDRVTKQHTPASKPGYLEYLQSWFFQSAKKNTLETGLNTTSNLLPAVPIVYK